MRVTHIRPRAMVLAGITLLLAGIASAAIARQISEDALAGRRIVSIADVHGAFDAFTGILREVGLVDENLDWAGGDTIMVQTGDFTDRGPAVRPTMDLLMRLQEQAPAQGGEVIVTLGNHEAMNLVGFLRDNSAADAAGFVDESSLRRQEEAWEEWAEMRRKRAASMDKPEPQLTRDVRRLWEESHPAGYVERSDALSPEGEYGRWLRQLPAVVRVGNILFMHAGLNPEYADLDLDEINERVSGEIQRFDLGKRAMVDADLITRHADLVEMITASDEKLLHMLQLMEETGNKPDAANQELARTLNWMIEYQSWQLLTRDGLLWFRGLAQWPEEEHAEDVAKILAAQGVDHIVVGHSVQLDGDARAKFDGAVFLTDTGMLTEAYDGRASALEIKDGTFTAIYVGERKQLYPLESGVPADHEHGNRDRGDSAADHDVATAPSAGLQLVATAPGQPQNDARDPRNPAQRAWLGSDGNPLPFPTDDEVLAFLTEAEVASVTAVGSGKTNAQLVALEQDGVRAQAIFHDVDLRREHIRVDGRFYRVFRDSWRSQVAAYRVARMLGFDNVAPTIERAIEGRTGSLQLWLENDGLRADADRLQALDHPHDIDSWLRQQWAMRVFDALILNVDRHPRNVLVDANWKLWMIDHTRAFQPEPVIYEPERLDRIERGLLQRLRELDERAFDDALRAYLERGQINAVLARRDAIVAHFERLIEERGEEMVVYNASTRTRAL